jgi:hypothetical protein
MARIAKATKGKKPAEIKRGPGRPKKIDTKVAASTPKLSKEALRDRVEKLERANSVLRAKGKDATKAAKIAAGRIAELEARVIDLEKRASPKPLRGRPKRSKIDPGDSVPPGVAVEDPEPMDDEAETAFENLTEHLHADTSE